MKYSFFEIYTYKPHLFISTKCIIYNIIHKIHTHIRKCFIININFFSCHSDCEEEPAVPIYFEGHISNNLTFFY